MIPDGTYVAVVDRIEETVATLVLEGETDEMYNLVVGEEELPADARHQDAVLEVVVEDEELVDAAYDEAETQERTDRAQSRFDQLSSRPHRDDEE